MGDAANKPPRPRTVIPTAELDRHGGLSLRHPNKPPAHKPPNLALRGSAGIRLLTQQVSHPNASDRIRRNPPDLLHSLNQFHFVAFRRVDESDHRAASILRRA